jgi:hypothetical protein
MLTDFQDDETPEQDEQTSANDSIERIRRNIATI